MKCKICNEATYELNDKQFDIVYHRCTRCGFIYEDPKFHLNLNDEKSEYDSHNNSIENDGYVNMFRRFIEAFEPYLKGKRILEYGSGPEPVLSELLRQGGYEVTSFDPFFLPDTNYLNKTYDLITSTEVFEHFVNPIEEIEKLLSLINKGGILAIMTQFPKDDTHFLNWWYRRDITHISFYTIESFEYIAAKYNLEIVFKNEKDYMIFKKV